MSTPASRPRRQPARRLPQPPHRRDPAATRRPPGSTVEIAEGLGELPFYNEDLDGDAGARSPPQRLRDQVAAADRVLAVTPEYNGTMPAVLNNAIDWLSRPYGAGALARQAVRGRSAPRPRRTAASGRTRTPAARPPWPARSSLERHRGLPVRHRRWTSWPTPRSSAACSPPCDDPGRPPSRRPMPPPERGTAGRHERADAVHLCRRRPRRHRVVRRRARRRGHLRADRDGRRARSATSSSPWTARAG